MNEFLKATGIVHFLLEKFLGEGQRVIDATAGNGHDTLFLAQAVGTSGQVYAFDIQGQALLETKKLLEKHNCLEQVTLIHDGHEKLCKYVNEPINVIMYNLGYLPGGNKSVITTRDTTLFSLKQGIDILSSGGVISLIVYPGHAGGDEEADAVEEFLASLSSQTWQIMKWCRVNEISQPAPYVLFIHKRIE